jgi:RNA polymerase sigma factor (sigma-70 family)
MTGEPSGESDGALAKRAVAGERTAFNVLVHRYQEPLYRFIRRYVGDADEAYDLLQETMIAAWQALGRYDPDRPALAWLRRIALNKCRDWGRRRTVRQFFFRAAPLEAAGATAAAIDDDDNVNVNLARLDAAIAALPSQLKEPLLLTAFEGLSQQEAADALGLTVKAIETRVYRARKLIAEAVALAARGEDA